MRKHCKTHKDDWSHWSITDPVGLVLAVGSGFSDGDVMDPETRQLGAALVAVILNRMNSCSCITPEKAYDFCLGAANDPTGADSLRELFGVEP